MAIAFVTVLPAIALTLYLAAAFLSLPPLGNAVVDAGQRALIVEADDGRVVATRGALRGQRLTPGDMPDVLKRAIVSVEDRRFYKHWGVDFRGLMRAAWRDIRGGGAREGGSTITQQYVRLISLNQEKTIWRKVQEAMLAFRVEATTTKDEILVDYLNTAYFGAGAYGADAAALRYFGKSAKELTLPEAAMLAGLVRAPSQLAPTRNFGGAKERAEVVLQTMVETGAITQEQAKAARKVSVSLHTPIETPSGMNYYLDILASDAKRLAGSSADGDLTVRSTLDPNLQSLAEAVIARRLDKDGERRKVSQAALVALSRDGAILAMVGGRDYEDSRFNRVTQAKRQPGSLFKLFVYLTAFEQGYTTESVAIDRPVRIGTWEPENDDGRYRGPVPLRTAFALSINTIAAQLGQAVGIPAVIATARKLGLTSELPNVPSLALGSGEVSLLEMTRAYAGVMANQAPLATYMVRTVRSGDAKPLFTYSQPQAQSGAALSGDSRGSMLDSLQAVVEAGTGRAAAVPGQIIGGKTGTSQDFRDAWFIGMTPDIVIGVWVGNDDNSPMKRMFGGEMPAEIFHDVIQRIPTPLTRRQPPVTTASAVPPASRNEATVRGVPEVVDTGTLVIGGQPLHMQGVLGEGGRLARQLARYLHRREITCDRIGSTDTAHCQIDDTDLAALILAAGGARAADDAPADLLAAEEQARAERAGLWRR